MDAGQQVTTADGRSGRIVALADTAAHLPGDDNRPAVSAVLLDNGEVRWYVESALTPLTRVPLDRHAERAWHPESMELLDASTFWG
jgi:hypothetical protein